MVQIRRSLTKSNFHRIDRLGEKHLVDSSHIVGARVVLNFIRERRSRKLLQREKEIETKTGDLLLRLRVYRPVDFKRLDMELWL